MNRASLLHILDHPSGISEAEVRELEQLAAAFPYCQTAHLLLAKAAHDRGSMLAGQRLRRAATYAADRELLRALIERPLLEPATAAPSTWVAAGPAPEVPTAPVVAAPEKLAATAAPAAPVPVVAAEPEPTDSESVKPAEAFVEVLEEASPAMVSETVNPAPEIAEVAQVVESEPETLTTVETAETAPEAPAVIGAEETAAGLATGPEASPLPESAPEADAQLEEEEPDQAVPAGGAVSLPAPDETEATSAAGSAVPAAEEAAAVTAEASAADIPVAEAEASDAAAGSTTEPAEPAAVTTEAPQQESPETAAPASAALLAAGGATLPVPGPASPAATDELPPAAPPIRPPVEAGSSRFEFGLGEAPEPLPAYQLPELPEEAPVPPAGFPPFRADELLAYALSGGSRLGSALTLRTPELTTDLPLEATWPADAAVLAHLAANRPVPPPAPSSLALIDKFLRSQPRIKNAQRPTSADSPQADLSVRSTSATPSLASESLAKIMVRQGKIGRAIEIYEQLMQRQPEKKAYFAAQIDLLNQHPE